MPPITVSLLGPARLSCGDRVVTIAAEKERALLAILCVEPDTFLMPT